MDMEGACMHGCMCVQVCKKHRIYKHLEASRIHNDATADVKHIHIAEQIH